jgi:glycosyltransferase involved in cell wall biosynthesis
LPSRSVASVTPHDEPGASATQRPVTGSDPKVAAIRPLTVLIAVPTLEAGAADRAVVDLVRILAKAGHKPLVVSRGGRLQDAVLANGGELSLLDVATKNPITMLRNAFVLARLVRERRCDVIHAHGRAPGWSALIAARVTRVPFITSWYKGFRAQNLFKRIYNSVMVRADRIVAVSDQIADLISERYGVPYARINVVPTSIDVDRFNPAAVSQERIDAIRRHWGVRPATRVILVAGRMLRRKGHDTVVRAAQRLKDMGLKDFVCIFLAADQGHGRYSGELWDLVMATNTADVVRLTGPVDDLPAAYAAATAVISASKQAEGLQRAILEAQAMARPVLVSDLGAGPEVVLAPPAVSEDRMTGLRFSAADDTALAAGVVRLLSMPEAARRAIGLRGRDWVRSHFNAAAVSETTLRLYAEAARAAKSA